MKKKLSFFMAICMILSVLMPQTAAWAKQEDALQTAAVIDVLEYGADPSGRTDSMPGIRAAIEAAKEADGPVILNFPKGEYQIYPDKAFEKELYVSNTAGADQSYRLKKIGFLFEGMRDVTLEGNGSFFMFHGEMTAFSTIDSENITFQNYAFDYFVPSVVDLTVESIEGNAAVIYVPECYPYSIDGASLTVSSDASPYTGQVYWRRKVNDLSWSQLYDVKGGLTWRTDKHIFWNLNSIEDIGSHRLKFHYSSVPSELQEGYSYQARVPDRDHPGIFFWKSKDIVMQDVDAHFLHGFGIEGQHTENITLKDMDFSAREETGRTTVGFADFIHMSGCKGKILIDGCSFSNPHDDPINVHGTFNQVTQRISDRQFKVSFMHYQTAGFPNFFVGDEVEFFRKDSLLAVENSLAKVVAVSGPTGYSGATDSGTGSLTDMILTLDRDMPEEIWQDDYVVENVTYTPEVEITNNVFKENPTRGILVTTRKPVLIKNNIFDGMTMASIYISNDAYDWYESGAVRDVTIEDNIFYRPSKWYGAIFIEPFNRVVSADNPVHENIIIRNNVFYLDDGKALDAKSVKNLQFTGNKLYRYNPGVTVDLSVSKTSMKVGEGVKLEGTAQGNSHTSDLYYFNGCKDIVISDNLYDGGLKLSGRRDNMRSDAIALGSGETIAMDGNGTTLPAAGPITYESSDESVVTVTAGGVAVGQKEGTAKVRACTTVAGRKFVSDWKAVTVSGTSENSPTEVIVRGAKEYADVSGEKIQFAAQVKPDGASQEVSWSVVDAKTGEESGSAAIDSDGTLTALSNGVVEVVATASNGLEGRRLFVISASAHALDPSWSILNADDENWSVAGEGKIKIHARPRGLWEDQSAKNIFLHELLGNAEDLTVSVKMSGKTVGEYEEAGLLFYQDNDNYVSIERKHGNGDPKIVMVTETNSRGQEFVTDNADAEDIWFQLEKHGSAITGYFSSDGESWTKAADCTGQTQLGDAFKIGFLTGNGEEGSTARTPFTFQEFTVNGNAVALTSENAAPNAVDVSCSYTEGKLNASWSFADTDGNEEKGTLIRWMTSSAADGAYEAVPGLEGNGVRPTASMEGRYVRAVVIPKDDCGLYGSPAFSAPVRIERVENPSVSHVPSAESRLSEASFTGVRGFSGFDSGTKNYMTSAAVEEDAITMNLKAKDEYASLEVSFNGEECISAKEQVSEVENFHRRLVNGYNVICVKVIAEDQVTQTDYRFIIIRTGEDDSELSGIRFNGKELSDFQKGTFEYRYTAERNEKSLAVAADAPERSETEIFVNGICNEGKTAQTLLRPGKNDVVIAVKPESLGVENHYHIEVTVPGDDNAELKTLRFGSGIALKNEFSSDKLSYQGTANQPETSLLLEAGEEDAKIKASLNGKALGEGKKRLTLDEIPMYQGENLITIEVTSPDGFWTKTYEISIEGSGDTYIEPSEESTNGWGEIQIDKSVEGKPIRLWMENGDIRTFEKGVGGHAPMRIVYDIEGMGFTEFSAYMGIDQEITNADAPAVKFSVYLDDQSNPVWTSGDEWITSYSTKNPVKIPVAGSRKVTIAADYWESQDYTHVSLGDAKFKTELPVRDEEAWKNEAAARDVIEKIKAIGTVTKDSKAAIEAARAAYEALTDAQKALVSNFSVLEQAEADYKELEETDPRPPATPVDPDPVTPVDPDPVTPVDPDPVTPADPDPVTPTDPDPETPQKPGNSGTPGNTVPTPGMPEQKLQKGKIYKSGKLKYKALTVSGKPAVSVAGPVKKTEKTIKIPGTVKLNGITCTVTQIANNAFKNNRKLQTVVVGKNVTIIGKNAFSGCKKLNSITIKSKKLKKAGKNAFKGIHKKAVIKVPAVRWKKYQKLLKKKGQSGDVIIKR